jgi:hypothetical protein
MRAVFQGYFTPLDGLDPGPGCCQGKLDRSADIIMVGNRHSRHLQLGRPRYHILNTAGPIQKRKGGMAMQMHKTHKNTSMDADCADLL